MSKIQLIIADKDKAYVESISNYIINNYSHRFQITSFTEYKYLIENLSKKDIQTDILLVCCEWYKNIIEKERIGTLIILSGGILDSEAMDCEVINKYQRGDKLVKDIINCFVEKNPHKYYLSNSNKRTKVVSVYSPIGGSGKTSIAIGCSIKSGEDGKSVFYLNLENMQTTPIFFDCEGNQNFSNILYYIKEKKKNITLKLEGIRCRDSKYDVYFFTPPDSCIDLNEACSDEIQFLINKLKQSNNYDYVFIDMMSMLDEKNIDILKVSDQIILVLDQEESSIVKFNLFMKELELLSKRYDFDLSPKIKIVLNKYRESSTGQINDLRLYKNSIDIKIPFVYKPIIVYKNNYSKEMKNEFKKPISDILMMIQEK